MVVVMVGLVLVGASSIFKSRHSSEASKTLFGTFSRNSLLSYICWSILS